MSHWPDAGASRPIYLDHHATTPVDPRVLEAMWPYFSVAFGNAGSDHTYGTEAGAAVATAREQVAHAIQATPREIIFTSGGTESNNLALQGVAAYCRADRRHLITSQTEHPAVLSVCDVLAARGWDITTLPVDRQGCLDPAEVQRAITPRTALISVMAANNEIGVISPLAEIGALARAHGVLFHTDAVQAVGHLPLAVSSLQVDLLSLSAHKCYGPKGIGALYIRREIAARLSPIQHGGGHEQGLRSGTLNVPGIVGLGAALALAEEHREAEETRLTRLRDRLWEGLREGLPDIELNGHPTRRLARNLNVYIPDIDARALQQLARETVAFSIASTCQSFSREPSHVILALGYGLARARGTLRFGLGRGTTETDIETAIRELVPLVRQLRGE